MKNLELIFMLLVPVAGWGAAGPAVTVHVQSSRLVHECDSFATRVACGNNLHLKVVVNGRKYELDGGMADQLLRTGDYQAKISGDDAQEGYEYKRKFEFIFPDGTKRKFSVIGEEE